MPALDRGRLGQVLKYIEMIDHPEGGLGECR